MDWNESAHGRLNALFAASQVGPPGFVPPVVKLLPSPIASGSSVAVEASRRRVDPTGATDQARSATVAVLRLSCATTPHVKS